MFIDILQKEMPPKGEGGEFSKTVSNHAKVKAPMSQRPTRPELIFGFRSMKQAKEYRYSPLDGMLVHRRVTVTCTLLYTWVKSEKVE